jgi:hypothetical protein
MTAATQPMFNCSACKKQYKWKMDFAGKKVKCKCGNVMTAPAQPPVAPVQEEDDLAGLYDLADQEKHAAKTGAVTSVQPPIMAPKVATAGAAVATSKPANPMLGYAGTARRRNEEQEQQDNTQLTEIWIPVILIGVGLVASMANRMFYDRITYPFISAMTIVGISLIVDMFLLAIGCLAAIKIMDVAFGAPGPAALKLTAIAIGPPALAHLIGAWTHDGTGAIAWIVSLLAIFGLLYWLFQFDLSEVILFSAIMVLIRMWVGTLIIAAIVAAMFAGAGPSVSGAALNADRRAADLIDTGRTIDAQQWFIDSNNHIFARLNNPDSMEIIDACIKNGCKVSDVQLEHSGPIADTLIAKLPWSSSSRKAIFTAVNKVLAKYTLPTQVDQGQTYLMLNF